MGAVENMGGKRGNLLAYGHAAYCAGWKAAMLCKTDPRKLPEEHSRRWIEGNPPESFDRPLKWRDGTYAEAPND